MFLKITQFTKLVFKHFLLYLSNLLKLYIAQFYFSQVGILGNAADLYESCSETLNSKIDRREMMIAFDMRCVGYIMAKMVLTELMDSSVFMKFKAFLTKGNDSSCLREFLLPTIYRNSSSGNTGLQILDRNWGAGWNLLSLLLATKPSQRIRQASLQNLQRFHIDVSCEGRSCKNNYWDLIARILLCHEDIKCFSHPALPLL